jgi:3-phosphoshikimate 1-carboxyvinyltransferase
MSDSPVKYPERIEIVPLATPPKATVRVPGSKSITNRALVLAALAVGECQLQGALRSEDTEVMVESLQRLGFPIVSDWPSATVRVGPNRSGQIIPARQANLFVANSGTTMRFLAAMVSLGVGRYRLDGVERMRERPIEDLLSALRQLGVEAFCERGNGCPPVVVQANELPGGNVRIRGDISSQFLSGLLMAAPLARDVLRIRVDAPLVSRPYVDMTLAMMMQCGVAPTSERSERGSVAFQATFLGRQDYRPPSTISIEPDATTASYFFGAGAICQGEILVADLPKDSIQGDIQLVEVLTRMGCEADRVPDGLRLRGAPLRGIDVDMNDISDTVMTLGAVALFADGPTTIRNVAHIRHKETDRLAALAAELRRVGAEVEEFADGLRITPRPLHAAEVETYNDHRMAMSMALVGLKVPGIVIKDPGCVAKTYPNFFSDLEKLRDVPSSR